MNYFYNEDMNIKFYMIGLSIYIEITDRIFYEHEVFELKKIQPKSFFKSLSHALLTFASEAWFK